MGMVRGTEGLLEGKRRENDRDVLKNESLVPCQFVGGYNR